MSLEAAGYFRLGHGEPWLVWVDLRALPLDVSEGSVATYHAADGHAASFYLFRGRQWIEINQDDFLLAEKGVRAYKRDIPSHIARQVAMLLCLETYLPSKDCSHGPPTATNHNLPTIDFPDGSVIILRYTDDNWTGEFGCIVPLNAEEARCRSILSHCQASDLIRFAQPWEFPWVEESDESAVTTLWTTLSWQDRS